MMFARRTREPQNRTMALLGLTLAVVGVYSVVPYAAAQRTQDIGIRMAPGAARRTHNFDKIWYSSSGGCRGFRAGPSVILLQYFTGSVRITW